MSIIGLQRRQRELGRIRMGDKGGKGQPQKLSHFRLTSAARHLLDEAAGLWGGEVREWAGAPNEGSFELYTQTGVLPIVMPPGSEPVSQWFETWSGGGCTHRCNGQRNHITDTPCSCDPDARACKATTRVNVMLPDLPDIGVWRLESHGLNAAFELPGTIDVIQMASTEGRFLTGRLRIEHRTSKKDGQTRKFIVPVIDLDLGVAQLMNGEAPERPALPAPQTKQIDAPAPEPTTSKTLSQAKRRHLFAFAEEKGVPKDTARGIARCVLGHGISEMGDDEVDRLKKNITRYAENQSARDFMDVWIAKNAPELLESSPPEATSGQEVLETLKARQDGIG